MRKNMVKSNFDSIDDFITEWFTDRHIYQKHEHLAFIILENHDIPWTWYKEKMLQLLSWNMQGGVTGAGSGHPMYFCKGDILETLTQAKNDGRTHAMVCQIGMVLCGFADQVEVKTPVQNFYEFSKSNEFMRAHILAHPEKPAKIHLQHFEINLNKWNGKNILQLGSDYKRSEKNIHDDYTPYWIEVPNQPRINNFLPKQREQKWFTYPHRDYEEQEQFFYDYIQTGKRSYQGSSDVIISALYEKRRKRFYYENNEPLKAPNKKYDLIFAPTSGFIAEFLYDKCGHDSTEIIIYDYDQLFLDVRRKILSMGLVGNDLQLYMKHLQKSHDPIYLFSTNRTPNQYESIDYNEKNIDNFEMLREKLADGDVKFMPCNLLEDDLSWIGNRSKDKSVLFYSSNIFKYYIVNMNYDYKCIKKRYNYLMKQLEFSDMFDHIGAGYK
tara:strand:+ start:5658 stop:6974 length:1317 start_codon:yes stop_codon:yes gene_type:complete